MNKSHQILLRRIPLFLAAKSVRDHWVLRRWLSHPSVPPPYSFKRKLIKEYARKHCARVFVETGTYLGDTTAAMRDEFDTIFSIELDQELHAGAVRRFRDHPHIRLLQGDSGAKIREVLPRITQKALFWLDGHYSAGITARADLHTPIFQELDHILGHSIRDHVVLIDDARCFGVEEDYPSIEQLKAYVLSRRPDARIEVEDDIIRVEF